MHIQGFIDAPRLIGDRRAPQRPTFLSSKAHRRLMEDLERYCRGELFGRSYLITGYRGAGKTAVTRRAVEDLYYEMLQTSLEYQTLPPGPRALQRPLLVKLNGPSLMALDPPPKKAAAAPAATQLPTAAERIRQAKARAAAAEQDPKADNDAAKEQNAPHETLKQVAIQLYRALADEISTTFAIKAKGYAAQRGFNGEEYAAQLKLDLDAGVDPGSLRDYWQKIGRFETGVLWPLSVDAAMRNANVTDQGLREIVAVATAGQAFQACTGKLEDSREDTRSANREAQVKAQGSTDLKELVGRLGALGVGGLTGAALWGENQAAAVGGGLLVWLLGTLSVGWSFTDTRKRDQVVKYTFLKDRTIETLDRDLPVIMDRVRDAGLAPIFVIDELDKVPDPEAFVKRVIARLKPIIVDSGFFIFLADRRYYDVIEAKVRKEPFGVEHTYFSERRLLAYSPDEYEAYLREIIVHDGSPTPPDELARTLLVLNLTHKARLNFTSLNRALAHLIDQGLVERPAAQLLARPGLVLGATVQLAIDIVLREGDLRVRMEDDPGFTQLVYDTLYAISNAWEMDEATYDTRREKLKAYLDGRADDVAAADVTLLLSTQDRLVALLRDFSALDAAVKAQPAADPQTEPAWAATLQQAADVVRLAQSVATSPGAPGLLAPDPDQPGIATFAYDVIGRPAAEAALEAAPAAPRRPRPVRAAPKRPNEVERLVDLISAFGDLLSALNIELADLSRARLLPDTLDWQTLLDARRQLGAVASDDVLPASVGPALTKAIEFQGALEAHGGRLSAGLVLARKLTLASEMSPRPSARDALSALARYPVFGLLSAGARWTLAGWPRRAEFLVDLRLKAPITGAAASVREFATALAGVVLAAGEAERIKDEMKGLWAAWRPRFGRYFDGRALSSEAYTFADLMSATERHGPSAWLRADLDSLQVADWSRFLLEALGKPPEHPVRWAIVAALRALRFESKLMRRVASERAPYGTMTEEDISQARSMAEGAPRGHKGMLIVVRDDLDATGDTPSTRTAQLLVRYSEFAQYRLGLAWLRDLDAFEGVTDELSAS